MSTTIFRKFWRIFCYCIPNSKVYKKTLAKFLKTGQKLCTKSQLSTPNQNCFICYYIAKYAP